MRRVPIKAIIGAPIFIGALLIAGLLCAYFPPSLTIKVIGLASVLLILTYARLAATGTKSLTLPALKGAFYFWLFSLGAIPSYIPFKFGPLPGLNPGRIAFWLTVAIWAYSLAAQRGALKKLAEKIQLNPYFFSLACAYLLWCIFCSFTSEHTAFSLYYATKNLLPPLLIALIAIYCLDNREDVENAFYFLLIGTLVACIAAVIEWRIQENLFLKLIPSDRESLETMEWIITDKSRSGAYRVSSTYPHPLALAEYLCICLPAAIALAATGTSRLKRLAGFWATPLIVLAIVLTETRSSLLTLGAIGLALGLLVGIRLSRSTSLSKALPGWGILIAIPIATIALWSTFTILAEGRNAGESGSTQARILMFNRGQSLVADQPVVGYGPGLGALKIGAIQPGARSLTIDSYYLSAAIETGLVGLFLFISLIAASVIPGLRKSISKQNKQSWFISCLIVSVAATLSIKLILSLMSNFDLLYTFMAFLVISTKFESDDKQPSQP